MSSTSGEGKVFIRVSRDKLLMKRIFQNPRRLSVPTTPAALRPFFNLQNHHRQDLFFVKFNEALYPSFRSFIYIHVYLPLYYKFMK